ncbi:MAG: protein kinase domain-containing protein, partial [Polyangiales bacterium]
MQEVWEKFATQREGRDPGETVTPQEHGVARVSSVPDRGAERRGDRELPLLALDADGDYEVTGVLGEGGMGRVLLARQRSLGRDVAIKVVKEGITEDTTTFGALFEEARITGSLEHPSIVPVHALGRDLSGRPVLVMKRVEGVAWSELLRTPDHPRWSTFGSDRLDA